MESKKLRRYILGIYLLLSLLGIIMVYSSTSIFSWHYYKDSEFFLKRQWVFFILGILSVFVCMVVNLEFLKKKSFFMLLGIIGMLGLVLFLGKEVGGAKRWFSLGGINFQPSEFAKVILVLYLCDYISRRKTSLLYPKGLIVPLGIIGIVAFLIFLEPDFGGAVFIVLVGMSLLFLGGMRIKYIIWLGSISLIILLILAFSSDYRVKRLTAFLNPWKDARGAGYQLAQSQIALGSGGIWGKGLGKGLQKHFYLPASHTDFIMAIIGEELGFVGTTMVLFLFLVMFILILRLTKNITDDFKNLLIWGYCLVIFYQVIINIGVVVGLLPTKGLPLPFVSYGGSSFIANSIMLGLIFNASKYEM